MISQPLQCNKLDEYLQLVPLNCTFQIGALWTWFRSNQDCQNANREVGWASGTNLTPGTTHPLSTDISHMGLLP